MDRGDILDTAKALTLGDRNRSHGDPLPAFTMLANVLNAYGFSLNGKPLTPDNACFILEQVKGSRYIGGAYNLDDAIDGAAYAAIRGELQAVCYNESRLESVRDSHGTSTPAIDGTEQ